MKKQVKVSLCTNDARKRESVCNVEREDITVFMDLESVCVYQERDIYQGKD